MFNAFNVMFLEDSGSVGPVMSASDILVNTPSAAQVIEHFCDALAHRPSGFSDLNVRVGEYPAVSATLRLIGMSSGVASITCEGRAADLILILSRRDHASELRDLAAFKAATESLYAEEVVDETLADIGATRAPIVVIARPVGPISPYAELALDRAATCLASAVLRQISQSSRIIS